METQYESPSEKSLALIQSEVAKWSRVNFGDQVSKATDQVLGSLSPLLGLVEEVGELSHVTLKHHQGIRGYDDEQKYQEERDDAVGDILIYLCDYASREGISLQDALNKTWQKIVKKRNWVDNPETGQCLG